MPLVLITDANVWIDLHVGGVLAEVVRLDFDLVLPDVVHAEMEAVRSEVYAKLNLLLDLAHIRLVTTGPEGVQLAEKLANTYREAHTPDLFALATAIVEQAVLVTGDKALRQAAETEKAEVHGTLWLLERMVEQAVLTRQGAHDALSQMIQAGRRLPAKECGQLLRRWAAR